MLISKRSENSPRSWLWFGALLLMLCCGVVQAQAETRAGSQAVLSLAACELPGVGGAPAVRAECGRLQVAENPQQPDGRQISLRVARVPARAQPAWPDPIFIFAGGPGQAATEIYPAIAPIFRELNRRRDIVLIDQRGTGGSNKLACPAPEDELTQPLDLALVRENVRACLAALDADPRFYTTSIAMADYDQVRRQLGYSQINLWGGSYGTRAAQVYLRQYPDSVRSMILDSVVPPRLALGSEHATQLDRVLQAVLARCAADQACHEAFPDLSSQFDALVAQYSDDPQMLEMHDPISGEPTTIRIDRTVFAGALRFLTYSSQGQALIPVMLHQAAKGQPEALFNSLLLTVGQLNEDLARGMELSVVCAEDEPLFGDGQAEENTLMGRIFIDVMRESCEIWPHGNVAEDFHAPFPSTVPTLLLAGEWDPVTPPDYAAEAAEQYANGRLLVVPGQGHLVTPTACTPKLITEFIDLADASELDVSCLEKAGAEPFFIDLNGPEA